MRCKIDVSTGQVQTYSMAETESEKTPGEGAKTEKLDYSHSPDAIKKTILNVQKVV